MTALVIFLHTTVCIIICAVILMQTGRGGGLTEGFASSAESLFGAQTNVFMVRLTSVLAAVFFVTSVGLAVLSAKKDKSIMPDVAPAAATSTVSDQKPMVQEEPMAQEAQPMSQGETQQQNTQTSSSVEPTNSQAE